MKGDPFETWFDNMFALMPGAPIPKEPAQTSAISPPYLVSTEYKVSLDDLIADDFCVHTPDFNIPLDDPSGYVLTTNGGDYNWSLTTSAYTPTNVCFYDSKGENSLTIDFDTGDVKLSAKMTIDEAAKLFWDKVMELNPMGVPAKYLTTYDPLSMVEDYIFPHPGTGKGSKVEFLPELPNTEPPKTPEEIALEAYTRAMKVVK